MRDARHIDYAMEQGVPLNRVYSFNIAETLQSRGWKVYETMTDSGLVILTDAPAEAIHAAYAGQGDELVPI